MEYKETEREVHTPLDWSTYEMQMHRLAVDLGAERDFSEERCRNYYDDLKKYDAKRFAEVVEWLRINYGKTGRFPIPKDFKDAAQATLPPQRYMKLDEREPQDPDFSKHMKSLADQFQVPDEERTNIKVPNQLDLFFEMLKKNMVWSYKEQKWIPATEGYGDCMDPEERIRALIPKRGVK